MQTGVFIISAPSGSGKTTLVERLLRELPGLLFSVSYTTRAPRGQEQNGREYCFITREEFESMVRSDELLEWAMVFGNYYGTARHFLDDASRQGKDLLLDIDVQGAKQVKEKIPDAVSVFILPPSREILEWRLRHRSQDSEEVIRKRLLDAGREIYGYDQYDYILINDQLDSSAERLKAIVQYERSRRGNRGAPEGEDTARRLADSCRKERVQTQVVPILASFGG
ncbi:MAG: guanylate kinase [Acidobacteria bacterium]|nr:guanylate kinase [Acidobacteriota bacterium]